MSAFGGKRTSSGRTAKTANDPKRASAYLFCRLSHGYAQRPPTGVRPEGTNSYLLHRADQSGGYAAGQSGLTALGKSVGVNIDPKDIAQIQLGQPAVLRFSLLAQR